jgi:carbamoyltransferase
MKYWGINALNHGSSLAVFSDTTLISFETCKSDELDQEIIDRASAWGDPNIIYWYENPWKKKLRQLHAGQYSRAFTLDDLPRFYLLDTGINYGDLIYTPHHGSHAAAGYYTSPFDDAAVVVLDAIGEFECASIWHGQDNNLRKVWHRNYPNSLGLFYSAFSHLVGFKPILEEHLFQSTSDLGDSSRFYNQVKEYFSGHVILRENLHKGVQTWSHKLETEQDRHDLAAAVQRVFEEQVDTVMTIAKNITGSKNLVYMGGCAMNSKYNQRLADRWDGLWSLPSPGDYSSAIGAALYHRKHRIDWQRGIAKHLEIKYNKA